MSKEEKKSIIKRFSNLLISISNREKSYDDIEEVVISISQYGNEWNRAAICLAEEIQKVPSMQRTYYCNLGDMFDSLNIEPMPLTTNELNTMALDLIIAKEKETLESDSKIISNKSN